MKTIHLAKADFLRDLVKMTRELYAIGDFTSNDPDWAILSAKLDGFIQAGLLIEVATRDEIQKAIDQVHWDVFDETREARRQRITRETSESPARQDWDAFDSPAYGRKTEK